MDDIRKPKPIRPRAAVPVRRTIRLTVRFRASEWLRTAAQKVYGRRIVAFLRPYKPSRRKHPAIARSGWGAVAVVMLLTVFIGVFEPWQSQQKYQLSAEAEALIGPANPLLTDSLKFDTATGVYEYNKGYQPGVDVAGENATPKFTASFNKLSEEGATVTDPVSQTSVTFKPDFALKEPIQDQNRLIYPLRTQDAVKVYTLKAVGFKEDIVLNSYQGDTMEFTYELGLQDGTEARMEPDGSLAVYGVDATLLGSVSTGSSKDEELLKKARENGEKNNLLFRFPAPFVVEPGKRQSRAKAWFSLNGSQLTVHAARLKDAAYPLSIDPSVYVETAAKLMRGNNETNVDFDVDNQLIQKGSTTGARFDTWNSTMALNAARWNSATAVSGGYIYSVSGTGTASVYWAKFNANNYAVESPNPGNGVCANWCTNGAYDLPAERRGMSLVAYNGFLYAIGGSNSSNAPQTSVYIAKLGANGEPQLWHPSGGTPVYWHADTALSNARSYFGAVAYNNRMYILGGLTTSNTLLNTNTVQYAEVNPAGTLSAWAATGMSSLPSLRYGHTAHVYNDRLYLLGGNSTFSGSPVATVHYTKLNSDGTMNSWVQTEGFATGRLTWGGSFTAIWGGYFYLAGGCSAVNASGYCSTFDTSVQLASINADGSLSKWGTIQNVTNQRIGYGLVAWRNTIYRVGGCSAQSTLNGSCTTTLASVDYGRINQDGDASTVATSVSSGTAPCSGGSPYNCDLPTTANIGHMLSATAIMNGYLYIIGGCTSTTSTCTTASGNTIYTAINSDGTLTRPASCPGGAAVDAYCVDSTDPVSGGITAAGVAVFNGRIYMVGGQAAGSLKGNIYHTAVNNDGSLDGAWTTQTFASIGATSVSYTFAYARANPASAGTNPGNLYIFGGCSGSAAGAGCPSGSNAQAVYKCNINTAGSVSGCTTSGQQQIGTVPDATGTGLALHAGTVYANYIYLIGGVAPGLLDLKTVRYAKFDNNNNVVSVDGTGWIQSDSEMSVGRRRGTSFGYNGYLYVVGGYDASQGGVLSDIQFAKVDVSDGSLGSFHESEVSINQRWGLSVPVSNSYAFVVGGCTSGASPTCNSNSMTRVVQTFQIYNNESGSPAGYSTGANLFATDRLGAGVTIHNGYIYVAGGCTSTAGCTGATSNVQYAPLDANGSIGTWQNTTASLPAARAFGQLEVAGGTLYYIGGQSNTATDERAEVYYATPSSGNVSSWTATTILPAARTQHSAAVWNGRLYVTGGLDSNGSPQGTVYTSSNQSSGGAIDSWTATGMTPFNIVRSGHTLIAYANNLYVLGGYDGSNYLNDVQFAKVNTDGTVGAWTYTTSLPTPVRQGDGFAANGYMYLFGGRSSDTNCRSKTLVAPISANTTIASGNNPTGIGEWYETNTRYNGDRYGAAVAYHEGKAYLLGGGCSSSNFPAVSSVTPSTFASNVTTHNVTMPATVAAGDLLLALFTNDGDATVSVSGWTEIDTLTRGTFARGSVWAKVATGSEGGTLVNFQTSDPEQAVAHVYRIPATSWYGSLADGVASAASDPGGTTSSPDPPSLDPSAWDSESTLWITYAGGSSWNSVSSYPSGYANGTHHQTGTDTASASASSARREAAVTSEDPDAFSMSSNNSGAVFTIAIRPSEPTLTYTGSNRVVQTALLSQPQVARYSRLIDTDTDVFPTKWLMNGVDNSVGARWGLRYRSMTSGTSSACGSMTTWGQETNFGNVTLGQPENYIPLNGSGAGTNCARYYYMSITIDSSQAYGYPDDVTRGPTLTDISLFFTADPSKRLRHGKTFTGGEQQPLDTPF